MHGHGYTQPVKQPPATGWLVFLRVLFVALGFLSIGLLAWVMLLRLAIVTRRGLDWGLFVAALAADVLAFVLIGKEPGDDVHTVGGWTGMGLLFGTLVAGMAYYLAADIRHFQQLGHGGYGPQPAPAPVPAPAPAYGFPQPTPPSPYTATPTPTPTPTPRPQDPRTAQTPPPVSRTPVPEPPLSTAPPQRPAPARIDQVRAELDELSDYLRRHEGHQDGTPEGGR
ncbi:hypothetical protein AB0K80_18165 [Streptomyces sp. NPDC052682]|uniref:hypothetical protein n=1 Tax=Streptomyces sp. NPDC052682 TaxID=3154954 RepID=UPI003425D6C5